MLQNQQPVEGAVLPFADYTEQRRMEMDSLTFAANTTLTRELPRIGYAAGIIVSFEGTSNLSAGGAFTDQGPWNIVREFRINMNLGSNLLYQVSGYGAFLESMCQQRGFRPDRAGAGDTTPSSLYYLAGVANGNNTWQLMWYLPISLNLTTEFDVGLIDAQASEVRITLEISCGQQSDAVTNANTLTGTFYLTYVYFTIPFDSRVIQPPFLITRTLETKTPYASTGEVIHEIPKMGALARWINYVTANAARTDAIDYHLLRYNRTDNPLKQRYKHLRFMNRIQYGIEFPVGVHVIDRWDVEGDVNRGNMREWIDSEKISTLENVVVITSGTGLGAGTNILSTVRKLVQVPTLVAA